jgi:hypothetical protein
MAELIPWVEHTGDELEDYRAKLHKKKKLFCDEECLPGCDGDHYDLLELPEELMFGD